MSTDAYKLLRDNDPAPVIDGYDPDRTRQILDRATTGRPAHKTPNPRARRLRTGAAVLTAAVLVSGGSVAYAVFGQPPESALQISCAVSTNAGEFAQSPTVSTVMTTTSGDPVADCAAEYERLYGQVPALRAYATGQSFITVVPAEWPVPAHWEPLGGHFATDPARVELESRLADQIEGPSAQCRDVDAVEALVRQDLADLGLTNWPTQRLSQAARADGDMWCAIAFPDYDGKSQVLIQGLKHETIIPGSADDILAVIERLRADIVERCVPLSEAERAAANAVQAAGFDVATEARITTIVDANAPCSRVDFVPAGLISITVRGPATP